LFVRPASSAIRLHGRPAPGRPIGPPHVLQCFSGQKMRPRIPRRTALACSLAAAPALLSWRAWAKLDEAADEALARLESKHGGRLGVAALDVDTGATARHRADERFPMCSTFKTLAVAHVLSRVDRGAERLERRIVFTADQLVTYSPVAEKRVGGTGMTLAELCEAAITVSDNTAANLLLASFGGPAALTKYARSIGDSVTRLDRIEPDLNAATPGDPRDTTSPAAMLETFRRLVFGNALSPASRSRLTGWLVANKTGDARLRAGFPAGWRVGDKTGSGNHAATNDVAIAWPPGRMPLLLSVYYVESSASAEQRNAVLAEVARTIAEGLHKGN
jgi:beta-lactamase class A